MVRKAVVALKVRAVRRPLLMLAMILHCKCVCRSSIKGDSNMNTLLCALLISQTTMWNAPSSFGGQLNPGFFMSPGASMNPAWTLPPQAQQLPVQDRDNHMLLWLLMQQRQREQQQCEPRQDHQLLQFLIQQHMQRQQQEPRSIDPALLQLLLQHRQREQCPPERPSPDPMLMMLLMQQRQQPQPMQFPPIFPQPPPPIVAPPHRHGLLGLGILGR